MAGEGGDAGEGVRRSGVRMAVAAGPRRQMDPRDGQSIGRCRGVRLAAGAQAWRLVRCATRPSSGYAMALQGLPASRQLAMPPSPVRSRYACSVSARTRCRRGDT